MISLLKLPTLTIDIWTHMIDFRQIVQILKNIVGIFIEDAEGLFV